MNRAMLGMVVGALCFSSEVALAQASVPSAPSPMNFYDKFRLYLRQTYSLPSVLVPAAIAGLDQAANSPNEWGQGTRGYLNRLGTQRGQFQIGAICGLGVGAALHEDPRFFPSGKHGMWRRTAYVVTHTFIARTDRGTEMPAFGNYAAAIGAGFFPSTWLPPSANSTTDSLKRSAAILGMNVGVNMALNSALMTGDSSVKKSYVGSIATVNKLQINCAEGNEAMLRLNRGAIGTWALVVLLARAALGEQGTSLLKPGDALPSLTGQTVAGKPLDLPTAASGNVSVVIFSFSRSGGRDAQNWAQRLANDDPHLPIYTAIFLESVPRMFRSIAVSGIRSGMPPAMLDRTLLLYQQQTSWEQRLHVADERYACVLVLNQSGRIRWISLGPFADSLYLRLRKEVRP